MSLQGATRQGDENAARSGALGYVQVTDSGPSSAKIASYAWQPLASSGYQATAFLIKELEAHVDAQREMILGLHQDCLQPREYAVKMEERATVAEDALERMRERARVLYDAIYRGKIARAEDAGAGR
jgi:hypothetical protein